MKRNALLDELRKSITENIKREVDLSFEIADRIHNILQSRGETQRDLAKALGKSESEICKWLRGTHNFTTKTIARLESVLSEPIIQVNGKQQEVAHRYYLLPHDHIFTINSKNICDSALIPMQNTWRNTPGSVPYSSLKDCI